MAFRIALNLLEFKITPNSPEPVDPSDPGLARNLPEVMYSPEF